MNSARFIRTVCMHRIWWSCEGLTSVQNEYTGYSLKHLLLRHMYNLSLPMLKCYVLKPYALRLPTVDPYSAVGPGEMRSTLYCVMAYIVACADTSRTVFWDRSIGITTFHEKLITLYIDSFWKLSHTLTAHCLINMSLTPKWYITLS